ncbi:uncharacterized protein CIMG_02896 [Coccidioides immitis RS]|uniref:Uncharacterized protein n=1 Tax=Coccidioides immitis (strain RS) TaxID=246410 RepID=A0A0E1S0L7_COCIM|nr:uncharacterized protein CIMG_02896 [Coccidioides immitis RS]EAS37542.2 hypothetical protein CIMG_02896 [Coccidioides immitis RS]TPX24599.1 hypothetical protein DIZ76_010030 [Coccidioides immitis]
MPTKRTLRGEITYSQAKERDGNVVHELSYTGEQAKFYTRIYRNRDAISELVAHHLGICPAACQVEEPKKWMSGSFNLCVPVNVNALRRVIMRFPLPYRVGENFRPGNADEKVRCEAATYAWISREHPSIPIPHLYGFALSTGQLFTSREHLPFLTQLWHSLKCTFRKLLRLPLPSRLVQHPTAIPNKLGPYLLIDFIEETDGRMLSDDWHDKYDDNQTLRMNLFRNLANVILTLSHKPLPKIGSFTIDNNGFLRLENRPLSADSTIVENEETTLDIPRDRVYHTVDSYVNDLLSVHDNYLRYQPNSLARVADCVTQMSALSMMRALSARFLEPGLNHGPFYLNLTDLHASNILVDEDWNIKYLIDLEWAIAQPLEFMQPPYWLTGETVDEISPDKYSERHKEFMEVFKEQERKIHPPHSIQCSSVMKRSWDTGAFWYILALQSPSGLSKLFYARIQPQFTTVDMDRIPFLLTTYQHWTHDAAGFLKTKVKDKMEYNERLQQIFGVEDKALNEGLKNDLDRFERAKISLG